MSARGVLFGGGVYVVRVRSSNQLLRGDPAIDHPERGEYGHHRSGVHLKRSAFILMRVESVHVGHRKFHFTTNL